ncbi:MAG: DUF748 domain-containing protein [Candidatus Electrothrix sp. Rat3]|nr:DUF748 domain-containing protein [Candidatus Electrothrix rattekaaiensis]
MINPHAGKSDNEEKKTAPPPEPKKTQLKKPPKQRKKSTENKGLSKKKVLRCSLILILLPTVLLLTYLAAARFLIPYYIQELAEQYSQQLHRSVTVTQVDFAPFTFDLHLAGIHIGPEFDRQDGDEPALCRIATLDTRLRPQELLQRRVVLEDVQIKGMQAEMVRRADGSFTDLGLIKKGKAEMTNQAILPTWMQIDGLSLTDSMFVIRDATSGHKYLLDEITFSLPSAASAALKNGETEPALHALVNGNPMEIRGQRQVSPDGSSATRLVLQLDDIDPQQILAWLPGINDSFRISTDKTKAELELLLPDNLQGDSGPVLSGTVHSTGLHLDILTHSKENKVERSGKLQCIAPSAQLVIRANPFRKQYTVEELTLDSPQLVLPENNDKSVLPQQPLSLWPGQLLDPASLPFDLMIHHLTINKGTLQKEKGPLWNDLQLEMTGYRNQDKALSDDEKEGQEEDATLSFSARQGETTVQFQGTAAPDLRLVGKISLNNLNSSILQPYLGKNKTVQLSEGKARLVMQVNPLLKQYKVDELTLNHPRFILAASKEKSNPNRIPLSVWPGQLFDPASLPFDLIIHHLTINKGTLQKEKGLLWNDLQLEMTGYRNRDIASEEKAQGEKATALSFSAQQGEKTVQFEGVTAPDLSLTGKISLNNLDPNVLQPYLNAREDVQLASGQAQVSGLLRTVQAKEGEKKKILLDKGTITLRDIRLKRKKQGEDKVLLTAQMAESKGCSIDLDLASPSIACTDLLLQKAIFSPDAPSFFLFPEKAGSPISPVFPIGLSIDALKVTDSKASLPLGSKKNGQSGLTIPLTALNLEIKNLQKAQSKKDNLHVQAEVGADGKLTADGSFRQGKGNLQLAVENLDIKLLNQTFAQLFQKELAPTLHQGLLSLQGKLGLPGLNFEGDARLKDLIAENSQGTALRWKNGEARQVLAGIHPFYIHIGDLLLQAPELKLNSPESKLPAALLSLLRIQDKKPVLPPFTIKQCSIQEGSMPSTGTRLGFTAINGNLAPLAAETPTSFTFSGKANQREFTAQGRLEQGHAEFDNFSVAELSLDNAAKEFAQQLGLEGKGEIRWVPSAEQKDGGSVHFSGFTPPPNAEFSLLLALLTDNDGEFSLPLSLPATASPAEISKAALKKLHRLHLQAVVSPQAVLEKNLPDLTLPNRVPCIVGDSLPDFMDNLENFASLFTRRPHLSLRLRGCYDDRADREYLLRLLQEEEDYRVGLENVRRQEEMARLLAEEELRQVELVNTDMSIGEDLLPVIKARKDLQPLPRQQIELPKEILPELARQRALVVEEYLIDTLKLPAEKITLAEPIPGGPRVDLLIEAIWQQPPETTQAPSQEQEE